MDKHKTISNITLRQESTVPVLLLEMYYVSYFQELIYVTNCPCE